MLSPTQDAHRGDEGEHRAARLKEKQLPSRGGSGRVGACHAEVLHSSEHSRPNPAGSPGGRPPETGLPVPALVNSPTSRAGKNRARDGAAGRVKPASLLDAGAASLLPPNQPLQCPRTDHLPQWQLHRGRVTRGTCSAGRPCQLGHSRSREARGTAGITKSPILLTTNIFTTSCHTRSSGEQPGPLRYH